MSRRSQPAGAAREPAPGARHQQARKQAQASGQQPHAGRVGDGEGGGVQATEARAEDPGLLLREVVASAQELIASLARRSGLAATDLRALDVLMTHGAMGPHELGLRLGLSPPAATALADRLERAGHVRRQRARDDRRRVVLLPTEHARQEAQRILGAFISELRAEVGRLSAHERAIIAAFLARVVEIQRRHTLPRD